MTAAAVATTMLAAGLGQPAAAGEPARAPAAVPGQQALPAGYGCRARRVLSSMTLEQRLGQLFMAGASSTSPSSSTLSAISTYHIGNVILMGRSDAGTAATARVVAAYRARATSGATKGVPLLIATDQEGGQVQQLRDPGFSRMPSALSQGKWSTSYLQTTAATWGGQLRAAGVNVNLAPVLDTVPSAAYAETNPPIGWYDRQFGYTSYVTSDKGNAFARGMRQARVQTAVKHFPGLGLVHANTDTTAGVKDTVTTRTHPYINPFKRAISEQTGLLMVSSAYYTKIDSTRPAVFSPTILRWLRTDLGYQGVVITDDVGAAKAVQAWTPGTRAYYFIVGGGDIVLNVSATSTVTMYRAMLGSARANATVRARVDASALRVLLLKERMGLLGAPC
ncbi:glycoside hydrolase family 3 N-terminal domain-containing protein [Actinomycetota bacterium]